MSARIVLLDEVTASRIAAGEVVERPASAVKELVENAIDAGATQIDVALDDGGKKRIAVSDDGCGMTAEEVVLAIQRHATSKITCADDLFAIRTLGFRGEALPSIASVSRFKIVTKSRDATAGCELEVLGGVITGVTEVGCRDGTHVTIDDLFHNTPARLKFLKTNATELARSVEIVAHLAAAYPGVKFSVRQNNQTVFTTSGSGDLQNALVATWGKEIARRLVPFAMEDYALSVQGLVGPAELSRPGRSHELFIVNGRPVRSRLLAHAVESAFRAITPDGRYPVACVRIAIDPGMVDVNVHPAKSEVKFTNERDVHAAVTRAMASALRGHGLVPELRVPTSGPARAHELPETHRELVTGERVQAALAAFSPLDVDLPTEGPIATELGHQDAASSLAEQLRDFRVLGQIRNTYIVASTVHGVAFVDQHVAHERVLYERFIANRDVRGAVSQSLAIPTTLELSPAETSIVTQRLADFRSAGWELEPFGAAAIVIRAIPAQLAAGSSAQLLRDMIDELAHQSVARRLIVERDQVLITNACRQAVKAGDRLSIDEMAGLLRQLAETVNPYVCPHGRPAVVTIPFADLDRRFRR